MDFTPDIEMALERSVLCWLATASPDGVPNVSPKEVFARFGTDRLLIANIASPRSVKNIRSNPEVCVGCLDIFVQKGYQLRGTARIVESDDPEFSVMETVLLNITGGRFPFRTLTEIIIHAAKPILAPSYLLYPETSEAEQIAAARRAYGFRL